MTEESIIEGIILDKVPRAEDFVMFTLFSKELGIVYLLKRISKRVQTSLPDYFDVVLAKCSKGGSQQNYFINSFEIQEKLCNFADKYKCLLLCGQLSKCIIKNAPLMESWQRIYNTFYKAISAYSKSENPEIVNIKWLYDYAKSEGYPVNQDFFLKLDSPTQNEFVNIIKSPIKDCFCTDTVAKDILLKLVSWINLNTDIIVEE